MNISDSLAWEESVVETSRRHESMGIDGLHVVRSSGVHPFQLLEQGYSLSGFHASNRYALSYLESGRPERYSQHGRSTAIGKGDLVLIDMQSPFSYRSEGQNETTLFFLLDAALVENAMPKVGDVMARRISGHDGWGTILSAYVAGLTPDRLRELSADEDLAALLPQHIASLLGNAFAATVRHPPESDGFDLRNHRAAELHSVALAWMREHFADEHITLQSMATQLQISKPQLQRVFKANGERITFLKTLHGMRLEKATHLLSDTRYLDLTVLELGRRCGFPCGATFYRLFIKSFGMPPSKYRRLFLSGNLAGGQPLHPES